MIHVLVTGSSGQLGQVLQETLSTDTNIQVVYTTREMLDITQYEKLQAYLIRRPVHFIINCAAYTQVDLAETAKEVAYTINAVAPGYLAMLAKELRFTLLHISTDYVFEGLFAKILTEEMPAKPVNYYGTTKLLGEKNILSQNTSAYIIRTSWLYSHIGNNFLTRLLNSFSKETQIHMTYEQVSSPTYTMDLAKALWQIIQLIYRDSKKYAPGIYHYANEGVASKYDFAWYVYKKFNPSCKLLPKNFSYFINSAKRPSYTVFDKEKIKNAFGITIPHWQESLADCLHNIR